MNRSDQQPSIDAIQRRTPAPSMAERSAPADPQKMQQFAQELRDHPERALKFFHAAGILNKDGTLAAAYRR